MISVMHNLTVGLFENLEITSVMNVDVRVKYTELILRVPALNKYIQVLAEFKYLVKGLVGYQCTLGSEKGFTMKQFRD